MVRALVLMTRSADLDETVGPEFALRLSDELEAALRRRPAQEWRLAGLLRVVTSKSERLRDAGATALDVLTRRRSLDRPLYGALLRTLVEAVDPRVVAPLTNVLESEDGGGLVSIAAAALSDESALAEPLGHLVSSRSPHIAFAAELARVARRESNGCLLDTIAPRIKESHRIELSNLVFLPLARHRREVSGAIGALEILRDSERHLGRWLCLAELEGRTNRDKTLGQARRLATRGPAGARAAWSLVAWALDPAEDCATRPTLESLARLSDRPSAERDLTFLFRMAEAKQRTARSMLESLIKPPVLGNDTAIRAAAFLVRDYGRDDLLKRLIDAAKSAKCEPLRGLALAAIADCRRESLSDVTVDLVKSRHHATAGFATLVRLAVSRKDIQPVITETSFRHLQLGWID